MTRPFLRFATTALAAPVLAVAAIVPASSDTVAVYSIQTGRSIVLKTPNLERVAVGDSKIAGIVPLGTSEVVVNGKTAGHTTIFIWMNGARRTYEFTVTDQNLDVVAGILRGAIDLPEVEVATFGTPTSCYEAPCPMRPRWRRSTKSSNASAASSSAKRPAPPLTARSSTLWPSVNRWATSPSRSLRAFRTRRTSGSTRIPTAT